MQNSIGLLFSIIFLGAIVLITLLFESSDTDDDYKGIKVMFVSVFVTVSLFFQVSSH